MASTITAGNATNGGVITTADTTGTLQIKTGTGAGTTAISIDASQNVVVAGSLSVTGGFSGAAQIQSITASVAANALTVTLNPTSLSFRSSTLSSGAVNTRTIANPISITVSSGSTLGTINNVASRIVVLAIDNAGTVELAVVNIAGGNQLDETNLISTTAEGGAGAADSNNVIYSTTARSSVPYRVVGFIDSTQTTAGTWTSAPTTVQGVGGQALTALSSIGYGQTWQDVSGSRAVNTTYYNTTGRPIMASVRGQGTTAASWNMNWIVNGVSLPLTGWVGSGSLYGVTTAIIPAGASYSLSTANTTFNTWAELR